MLSLADKPSYSNDFAFSYKGQFLLMPSCFVEKVYLQKDLVFLMSLAFNKKNLVFPMTSCSLEKNFLYLEKNQVYVRKTCFF